jgi:L-amino acid N-acyltransferase YncA
MDDLNILKVTVENVSDIGIYCSRDKKSPGFRAKAIWFKKKINDGLVILVALDNDGQQLGFIEYIPVERAWRPVQRNQYLFIHCVTVMAKGNRQHQVASTLIEACEVEAMQEHYNGICVMVSEGAWMADKRLFIRNGFSEIDALGRFELLVKRIHPDAPDPQLINWVEQQPKYQGWNLVYADQCPWHQKSVNDLKEASLNLGIDLKIKKLESPAEAKAGPSGFGTFSILYNGKLLEDHYLSRTRFESIVKQQQKARPTTND